MLQDIASQIVEVTNVNKTVIFPKKKKKSLLRVCWSAWEESKSLWPGMC